MKFGKREWMEWGFFSGTVILLTFGVIFLIANSNLEQQKNNAIRYGEIISSSVRLMLNESLNESIFLENIYEEYGDEVGVHFDNIAARMLEENPTIGSVYIAPYDKITYAYPESVKPSTMGFEARKDPNQGEKARQAADSGKITVAGPHNLLEGGVGFIIRDPMYRELENGEKEFTGFTVVILDWDKFTVEVLNELEKESVNYEFGIWKENDANAVVDENGFILTNSKNIKKRYFDFEIEVPNDIWHLTVQPAGGFNPLRDMARVIVGAAIIAMMLVSAGYLFELETMRRRDFQEKAAESEGQAALAEYRDQMIRVMHEALGSGMWSMDFDEKARMVGVHWSDEFRRMLGFNDVKDFPDRLDSWSARLHPEEHDRIMKEFYDTVEDYTGRKTYNVEYRLRVKSGEWRWYRATGRLIRRPNGSPKNYVGMFVDITQHKEQDQLLHEALKSAENASREKTEFLSSMSHDIRTPLNGIIGMTAIAENHLDDKDKVKDCLSKVAVASRHLLSLINEILDMNKIESGKVELQMEAFNLSDLIENLLDMVRPQVQAHNHELIVRTQHVEHENVVGDSVRIQQVFVNIMGNAIKYTPDGGTIIFTIEEKPTNVKNRGCFEFVFEDNGLGMSEEFLTKIFEPFSRAEDHRTSKTVGSGLGMPITRNIVRMMNGDIKVESKLNEGSKFTVTVYLPLQEGNEGDDERLVGRRVLIIDDEADSRESIRESLKDMKMPADVAATGEEGMELIRKQRSVGNDYFAVLLDWQMPKEDGVVITKRIRGEFGNQLPIVIISGYDWSDVEMEAREVGANAFLSKPLFRSRLTHMFHVLLGLEGKDPAKIAVSPLEEMDLSGRRILLVEDMEMNAEIAKEILGLTKAEVEWAEDGEEAVKMFSEKGDKYYDMILMDVRMPKMNGYEATEAIRALGSDYARDIPIVAMTADAFAEDVRSARDAGMNDHISKPIEMRLLAEILEKYL